jgi:hypothetical protein
MFFFLFHNVFIWLTFNSLLRISSTDTVLLESILFNDVIRWQLILKDFIYVKTSID